MAINIPVYLPYIVIVIALWELAWKGLALWKSARNEQKVWYVCILIFNTIGILPITYLLLEKRKR